jgi:hypothetical protein
MSDTAYQTIPASPDLVCAMLAGLSAVDRGRVIYRTPKPGEQLGSLIVPADLAPSVVATPDPAAVSAAVVADYQRAIEAHVEAGAAQRGYSSSPSCAGYVASTVPKWKAEALAFIAWRDAVWVYVYNALNKVKKGERPVPTVPGLIAELPALVWPNA